MPDSNSNNKRIARNSIFMSIRMVIVLGLTFYTTRAVLDKLGVVDYGIYNVVCGFVSMFAFLNTSMSNGIQRFFNFELGQNGVEGANKVYNMALFIQLILAVLIILATESFGIWYLNSKMVIPPDRFFAAQWIFQSSMLSFLFIIMQAPFSAAIMAHERLDFYAIVNILDALLKLVIVFIISYLDGDRLIWYGFLLSSISILNFLLYYSYCKYHFKEIYFNNYFDRSLFKSMLTFSGWNIFGSFSGMMKEQGINMVINLFFGPVVNAARGVAVQVNGGLQSFVQNITTPVRPQVIQSYAAGNIQRTINLTLSVSKLSCIFLYMMALPIVCEIDYVLNFWLGGNVPDHTASFVYIIILISFLNNLNSAVSGVVHASGKMKLYQLSTSIVALLAIPLSYCMLRIGYAAEWALWSVLITMFIAQIVSLLVLKTIIPLSISNYIKKVIQPLLLVVVITIWFPIIISSYMEPSFIRLCFNVVSCVVSISISTYLFGLDKSERKLINQMMTTLKLKINRG